MAEPTLLRRIARAFALSWAAIAVTLAAACSGGTPASPSAPSFANSELGSVTVQPSPLMVGETGHASVWGWSRPNGSAIYGPLAVTGWTSASPAVARVDSTGRVTAVAPGTARLIATLTSGATPWDVVTVFGEADVTGLQLKCPASLGPREGGECRAEALTRASGAFQVRASWASSAPAVIDLSLLPGPAGSVLLIPRGAGQTVITATFLGFRATATVVVTG